MIYKNKKVSYNKIGNQIEKHPNRLQPIRLTYKWRVEMNTSSWIHQDTLKLSVEQWKLLLSDREIFNDDAIRLISFVYSQPQHQSSATKIGIAFNGVSQQRVTALNRSVAKKIYEKLGQIPPFNSMGGKRYWNVIFDGNPQCEVNNLGHFIWKLRPNLIIAMREMGFPSGSDTKGQ